MYLIAAAPAAAQEVKSGTGGLAIGAALNGSSVKIDDPDFRDSETENGGGLAAFLGYNFSPSLGVFLHAAGANIDSDDGDYTLAHFELTGRYTFANPTSAAIPYVEIGYAGVAVADSDGGEDVSLSGNGITFAGGLHYFLNPRFALDGNLRAMKGEFTTLKIGSQSFSDDDGIGTTTARLNLGVAFYPRR
jgi:hypothetical protein